MLQTSHLLLRSYCLKTVFPKQWVVTCVLVVHEMETDKHEAGEVEQNMIFLVCAFIYRMKSRSGGEFIKSEIINATKPATY